MAYNYVQILFWVHFLQYIYDATGGDWLRKQQNIRQKSLKAHAHDSTLVILSLTRTNSGNPSDLLQKSLTVSGAFSQMLSTAQPAT